MFPVRCFSCGKVIGQYEQKYSKLVENGINRENALNTIGMTRYCCRRMFLGHVELIDQLLKFSETDNRGCSKNLDEKNKK